MDRFFIILFEVNDKKVTISPNYLREKLFFNRAGVLHFLLRSIRNATAPMPATTTTAMMIKKV